MNFPAKILVVDDEAHVRTFLGKLARAHLGTPTLFEASDAASALEIVRRERPELVLLDTNLIGTSGLQVLEQIREFDEETVIIMLSTVSVISAIREAVDRGANGYILKNVGSEEVARSLLSAVTESFGDEEESDES